MFFNHLQPLFEEKTRASKNPETLENIGDRERIRTAGLPLRRRSLYPAELHNLVSTEGIITHIWHLDAGIYKTSII